MLVRGYGSMAVVGVVLALIGWGVSSVVLFFVGTRLLPGKNTEADMGQVLRATGFAQAPQLLNVFAFIPVLGFLIRLVTAVWSLVALVIAVRQALDYDDTMRAVIVCLIAWAVMIVFTFMMTILGFGATMGSSLI